MLVSMRGAFAVVDGERLLAVQDFYGEVVAVKYGWRHCCVVRMDGSRLWGCC
jgi:hypothetical protein